MKKIVTEGKRPPIDAFSRWVHDQYRGNQQALQDQYGERFGLVPNSEPTKALEPPKAEATTPEHEPDNRTEQEKLDDAHIAVLIAEHRARQAEESK